MSAFQFNELDLQHATFDLEPSSSYTDDSEVQHTELITKSAAVMGDG